MYIPIQLKLGTKSKYIHTESQHFQFYSYYVFANINTIFLLKMGFTHKMSNIWLLVTGFAIKINYSKTSTFCTVNILFSKLGPRILQRLSHPLCYHYCPSKSKSVTQFSQELWHLQRTSITKFVASSIYAGNNPNLVHFRTMRWRISSLKDAKKTMNKIKRHFS